jgi:hypothetical protein
MVTAAPNSCLLYARLVLPLYFLPALVVGLLSLPLAGCGGATEELTTTQKHISDFNSAVFTYQDAMEKIGQTVDDLLQIADIHADPGTLSGLPIPMTQLQLEQHATLLEQWNMDYRNAFVAAYRMVMAAHTQESEQLTSGLWFAIPGENLETALYPELFTLTGMALMAGGVALSTWLACKKSGVGLTKACRDIKNIILVTSNQACLEAYAGELKMSPVAGVAKDAILAHMENHPNRASLCTKAAFNMLTLVDSADLQGTNCQVPSPSDMTNTRFEVTQDVVEVGANYSVAMTGTVTSNLTSLIIQAGPVSEGAKVATELGITLTETAMSKYSSTLPKDVTVMGVAESATSLPLPTSSGTNSAENGISVILDEQSGADMVREAFDDLAAEVADAAGIPVVSNTIDVPNNIFIGSYGIDGLEESVVVPIPNIGFGTVMVLSQKTVPEITEHVDTAQDGTIDFSGIGISQWGEEPKNQDNTTPDFGTDLTVTGPVGSVSPGTDVNLTVACPVEVPFPATLETNSLSGVSLAWSSFTACPISVLFNADAVGTYNIQFTLTDANQKKWIGGISVKVAEGQDGFGTWTDSTSGLTWQNPPEEKLFFSEAKEYCGALALDGGGWRMPNISELRSLVRGCPNTVTGGACAVTDSCLAPSCFVSQVCAAQDICDVGNGPANGIYWPDELFWMVGESKDYLWGWSSSHFDEESAGTVIIDFARGWLHGLNDDSWAVVRCVR